MSAAPAFKIEPNTPQAWRSAFLDMRPSVIPCSGLTAQSWQAVHAAALDFLDHHADRAAELGWSTLELFGVHPEMGTTRVDFCGALPLGSGNVTQVTFDLIRFGNTSYYRNVLGRPKGAVPIWAVKC